MFNNICDIYKSYQRRWHDSHCGDIKIKIICYQCYIILSVIICFHIKQYQVLFFGTYIPPQKQQVRSPKSNITLHSLI